jgi:hypothetical protein
MLVDFLLFIIVLICWLALSIRAYIRFRRHAISAKNVLFLGMGWVVLLRFGMQLWSKMQSL